MCKMTTASSLLKGHLLMHQVALIEKYSLDVYNKDTKISLTQKTLEVTM